MQMDMQTLKKRARGISLGLYAADLGDLRGAAMAANSWGCDIVHFDEMDGCFVPAMIGGAGLVKAAGNAALRDVHLMISKPAEQVPAYLKAGADLIVIHAEAENAAQALALVKAAERPVLAGIALMPDTPLDVARDLDPDMVLILSLDPRDGKPPEIAKACARLTEMRRLLPDAVLAFDGGVTADTIEEIAAVRPDIIVSGSAVMKADNPAKAFADIRDIWQNEYENH